MLFKDSEARKKYNRERARKYRADKHRTDPDYAAREATNERKRYWAKRSDRRNFHAGMVWNAKPRGYTGLPKGQIMTARADMRDRLRAAEVEAGVDPALPFPDGSFFS